MSGPAWPMAGAWGVTPSGYADEAGIALADAEDGDDADPRAEAQGVGGLADDWQEYREAAARGALRPRRNALTPAERGRLGGMRAAERMTPEERSLRASRGAAGLEDRLQEQGIPLQHHMTRLALRRRGKKVRL